MKKLKLYLETTIWNFLFADDAPEKKKITEKFFREITSGKYEIFISELVIAEIHDAPLVKRDKLLEKIQLYDPKELTSNRDVEELSKQYISAKIVPQKHESDVIHIAFAVAHDLDVLVSWNLTHIVKLKTKLEVNGINKSHGYKEIEICTPEEVVESERT